MVQSRTEPPEAPAPAVVQTAPETATEQTLVTTVFAPSGSVPKAAVLQTAIQSVRDAIPVVFKLDAEITGATKVEATNDREAGTEFEVTVTYVPRATAGAENPVDPDLVIRGLDVPRSIDGIGGHQGDPNFLER